jgi:hypothetical protein
MKLIPAPIAAAIPALRKAASFFDVLEFCGASCGDGVCPRGEIEIASKRPLPHVLGPIFLVVCFKNSTPAAFVSKSTDFFAVHPAATLAAKRTATGPSIFS